MPDPKASEGQLIAGRYRVERLLGEGSFARVYLAEQISVGRKVAVKILQRDLDPGWDAVTRFQEEAKLLASVRSPSVVEIHDIGRTEKDDPYIVMEYVEGRSLATVLAAVKRIDQARAIHILLQIAGALCMVHEAGVVHRDLKPANIMLLRGPAGRERVKILDFGLAKASGRFEQNRRVTRAGLVAGTPQFMAPEQVSGGDVDARADLYAFGCIAYRMLTGEAPFKGSEDTTMRRRTEEEVVPLRQACPHANIPASLELLVMRALARDPADRPRDADELQTTLLAVAASEGMASRDLVDARLEDGVPDQRSRDASKEKLFGLGMREWALVAAILFVVGIALGVVVGRVTGP